MSPDQPYIERERVNEVPHVCVLITDRYHRNQQVLYFLLAKKIFLKMYDVMLLSV